jgi:glutaryl-CoA dehydrogenase
VAMELARVDSSIATFTGVHSGLAMGSIYLCGSEEQKQRWLPAMARFEKIGAFGLTEPEVGSGASGGLTTTARREGDSWVLNGQKKWIGNATFSDVTVIWARDVEDNQVKGFLVEIDMSRKYGLSLSNYDPSCEKSRKLALTEDYSRSY